MADKRLAATFAALCGLACVVLAADFATAQPAEQEQSGTISLHAEGKRLEIEFHGAPRREVVDRLFAAGGAEVEWLDAAYASEKIGGRYVGAVEEIAERILAGASYNIAYDMSGGQARIKRVIVQGRGGNPAAFASNQAVPKLGAAPDEERSCETGSDAAAADGGAADTGVSAAVAIRARANQIRLDDGRLLTAGGIDGCSGAISPAAELFDPSTGQSTPTGAMSIGRASFPMHRLPDGNVVVFGGEAAGGMTGATDRVEEYEVAAGKWSIIGYLAQQRGGLGSCELPGGKILLIGGRNGPDDRDPARTRSAEMFDPASYSTRLLPARTNFEHGSFVRGLMLGDGRCLISSEDSGFGLETFDPVTETFSAVRPFPGLEGVSANATEMSLLPDGTVLIVASPSMIFDPGTGNYHLVPN